MMKKITWFFIFAVFGLKFNSALVLSEERPKEITIENSAKAGEKKDEKKPDEKPFDELIKDFTVKKGLFTFYIKESEAKAYMEILPEQLDKLFICSMTRSGGDGQYFVSDIMSGEFPFILKRIGKSIQFLYKNVYFKADKNTPISKAVERGITDSLMGTAKIEGIPHPERKSILIDPTSFFIQDIENNARILSEGHKTDYSFDKDNSSFEEVRSFPENTEIGVALHFKASKPKPAPNIPDARSLFVKYHYSLSNLTETNYKPRFTDDRVGHFLTIYQDYTNTLKDSAYTRYINRWHLEKENPDAEISVPKKPIVFWLENTIPKEFREPVKEGALLWNKAFERIGFKEAIVVKEQPDDADWDPADVRYNTIRWFVHPGAGFAIGPSRANPFTGQIYDADISVSADFLRYIYREYEEFVDPVSLLQEYNVNSFLRASKYSCNYAAHLKHQLAFGFSLLQLRGTLSEVDSERAKKFVHDYIVNLIAHEVGHTLGLRHNFKASAIRSSLELQDEKLTKEEGLTGSVMDYLPVNLSTDEKKQGQYMQTSLGPWDYWVIEYAYKPIKAEKAEDEIAELNKIASRSSEPKLVYGTDEDTFFVDPRGIDPESNVFDLGSDPMKFYEDRIALAKELWSKIEKHFEKPGTRYQKLRLVFGQGLSEYGYNSLNVSKYIGGIRFNRAHIGDRDATIPFSPVPAGKQKEALQFLQKNIFSQDSFSFSPSLLNKLAPETLPDFEGSVWSRERIDYPIHKFVLLIQERPLSRLYHPIVLSRIQDSELRYEKKEDIFTMTELFVGLRDAIWSEVIAQKNINSFRRNLQRTHLNKLIELVVSLPQGTPEDATTLARVDLIFLKDNIQKVLKKGTLNYITSAHLKECSSRIDAALNANLLRKFP